MGLSYFYFRFQYGSGVSCVQSRKNFIKFRMLFSLQVYHVFVFNALVPSYFFVYTIQIHISKFIECIHFKCNTCRNSVLILYIDRCHNLFFVSSAVAVSTMRSDLAFEVSFINFPCFCGRSVQVLN